jgi:cytidine deaminase
MLLSREAPFLTATDSTGFCAEYAAIGAMVTAAGYQIAKIVAV